MNTPTDANDLHEGQHLEFKEAHGGLPRDVWETYSAFANTEGGEIVLGVREPSPGSFEVVGVDSAESLISQFWTSVRNRQVVDRDVMLLDGVREEELLGRRVVVIEVPRAERGEKPVRAYDKKEKGFVAYVRRGEDDLRATDADLRLMSYDGVPGADRRPLHGFEIDSLCPETVSRYRNVFSTVKGASPWNGDSTEDFLFHIGALAKDRDGCLRPTIAGLLSFGHEYAITSYSPHYLLDYREERSKGLRWDDRLVSQSGDWSGNLLDFYWSVSGRLARNVAAPFSTDEVGARHGSANPVSEALGEAVVNALVHAYYGATGSVRVLLEPDGLRVTNPGSMLIDRDVAIAGGASESRNPTLMRIFSLIGASDRAGSGLYDIWSTWRSVFGAAPVLTERHSPSAVELFLPLAPAGLQSPPAPSGAGITADELSRAEGITRRSAQRRLRALFEQGEADRRREGRSWRYYLR